MFISSFHGPWSKNKIGLIWRNTIRHCWTHARTRAPVGAWLNACRVVGSLSPSCSIMSASPVMSSVPVLPYRTWSCIRMAPLATLFIRPWQANSVEFAQTRVPQRRCRTLKAQHSCRPTSNNKFLPISRITDGSNTSCGYIKHRSIKLVQLSAKS